jgi:hypothetical protein
MTSDDRERTQRLQVMLTTEELKAVEEFRFEHRLPSRAAAVRELMRRGLRPAEVSQLLNADSQTA